MSTEHALDMELDVIHVWCGWHMRLLGRDESGVYVYECPKCHLMVAIAEAVVPQEEEQTKEEEQKEGEKKEKRRRRKKEDSTSGAEPSAGLSPPEDFRSPSAGHTNGEGEM